MGLYHGGNLDKVLDEMRDKGYDVELVKGDNNA